MERIAVTGGCGLLGGYVTEVISKTAEVTVLDKSPVGSDVATDVLEADVMNLEQVCDSLSNQEAVVHLAGLDLALGVSGYDFYHVNVQGTWNVLRAAELHGIRRVVIASSVAALGIDDMVPGQVPEYLPVDEEHALKPVHSYGLSKQVMEVTARSFVRRGHLEVIALRPVLIAFEHIMESTVELIERRDVNREYGHLTPSRCFVSPRDAARCFDLALHRPTEPFDVFLVAAPQSISPEPTLDNVQRRFGVQPPVVEPQWFQGDARAAMINASKARRVLGWVCDDDWNQLVVAACV